MARRFSALVSFLRAKRYLKWRILAATFIALILLSRLAVWFVLDQTNAQAARQNFDMVTEQRVGDVQKQFEIYANTLYAARALFLTGGSISRQGWEAFVDAQKLNERYPAFYALAYISSIHQTDIDKLTAQLNASRLTSETYPVVIKPLTTGDTLAVVTYIAPGSVPQTGIGLNALADPARAKALAEARDSGLPRASKPLALAADPADAPPAMLIVLPVYISSANDLQTTAQRQADIQGYVVAALRVQPLLDAIFSAPNAGTMYVSIASGGQTIYQHGPQLPGAILEKQEHITVAGQTWTLNFRAAPGFGLSPVAQLAPTALTLSALPFLFAVGLILYFSIRVYKPSVLGRD